MSSILIVEDTQLFREMLIAVVRHGGHQGVAATNGREALEILETLEPNLIILDSAMPEMDGLAFLKRLRGDTRWKEIPVLLVSGVVDDELERAAKALSVSRQMLKSAFSIDDLLACITEHARGTTDS